MGKNGKKWDGAKNPPQENKSKNGEKKWRNASVKITKKKSKK